MSDYVRNILFGVILLAVTGAFVRLSSDHSIEGDFTGYTLKASFQDTSGLNVGAHVYMAGILIGRVTEKSIMEGASRTTISLYIVDASIVIPTDSSISIQTDGLFGSKFLSVEPGADSVALVEGDAFTYTESSLDLSTLLDQIIQQGEKRIEEQQGEEVVEGIPLSAPVPTGVSPDVEPSGGPLGGVDTPTNAVQ